MNVWPFNSKKTVNPESDVIFEFGNNEQYNSAASLAFPSNQKHGYMLPFMGLILIKTSFIIGKHGVIPSDTDDYTTAN
jgi:hypothetical protein